MVKRAFPAIPSDTAPDANAGPHVFLLDLAL